MWHIAPIAKSNLWGHPRSCIGPKKLGKFLPVSTLPEVCLNELVILLTLTLRFQVLFYSLDFRTLTWAEQEEALAVMSVTKSAIVLRRRRM